MGFVGSMFEDKNANEGRTIWCFPIHKRKPFSQSVLVLTKLL